MADDAHALSVQLRDYADGRRAQLVCRCEPPTSDDVRCWRCGRYAGLQGAAAIALQGRSTRPPTIK